MTNRTTFCYSETSINSLNNLRELTWPHHKQEKYFVAGQQTENFILGRLKDV